MLSRFSLTLTDSAKWDHIGIISIIIVRAFYFLSVNVCFSMIPVLCVIQPVTAYFLPLWNIKKNTSRKPRLPHLVTKSFSNFPCQKQWGLWCLQTPVWTVQITSRLTPYLVFFIRCRVATRRNLYNFNFHAARLNMWWCFFICTFECKLHRFLLLHVHAQLSSEL